MTDIGKRMKENYKSRSRQFILRRVPVILRLDGKSFHSYTRGFNRPFDIKLLSSMITAAQRLSEEIQGVKCAYIQSDEVSFLITDMDRLNTEAWFNYNVQKMCSVASSIFTFHFNNDINKMLSEEKSAYFDARVFNIPFEEVVNYFVWRQKDWVRNSIQMLARSYFSHKECYKKSMGDLHDMLHNIGVNWNDLQHHWKNGVFLKFDGNVPHTPTNFNDIKEEIEKMMEPKE